MLYYFVGPGMGGMGGMEGGENWNMAMGMHGGPPGPGFHPMPVPMPNPGMGGNGPVMSGPRPMIRPQRRGMSKLDVSYEGQLH